MEVWGDKIIMELNDTAKNGDVETAWDSSEVGADAGVEYVPLMRVENSSFPSPQPNTATSNQHNTIEGISTPRDPCGWDHEAFKKFALFWFATWFVLCLFFKIIGIADNKICGEGCDGTGFVIMFSVMLFPLGLLIAIPLKFCWVTWTNYLGYDICENFAVTIKNFTLTIKKKCNDISNGIFETLRKMKFFKGYEFSDSFLIVF